MTWNYIVRAIIDMARALDLRTVAEGVETAAQLALLCSAGCTTAQGYLFSKPLAPEAFETFVVQSLRTPACATGE